MWGYGAGELCCSGSGQRGWVMVQCCSGSGQRVE